MHGISYTMCGVAKNKIKKNFKVEGCGSNREQRKPEVIPAVSRSTRDGGEFQYWVLAFQSSCQHSQGQDIEPYNQRVWVCVCVAEGRYPGDSVRYHRLRTRSPRLIPCLRCQLQAQVVFPVLWTVFYQLLTGVATNPSPWVPLICLSGSQNSGGKEEEEKTEVAAAL